MKKKYFGFFVLGMCLSLVGCGNKPDTSSEGPIINLDYDAEDIWRMLNDVASNGNYTLEYPYGNQTFHEFYTPNYAYFEGSKMGYVGLPDYQDQTEKLFYKCMIQNGNVEIYQALGYRESENVKDYTPIRSHTGLDYMYLLVSGLADVGLEDIQYYQRGYYTENMDLITILANVMGYGDSANLIGKITFEVIDDSLHFVFYPNFLEGYEVIDGVSGAFTDIGSTRYEILENYLATFEFPKNTMSTSMLADFTSERVSLNAKVTRIWSHKATDELEDTEYDYSNSMVYLSTYYGTASYGKLQYPSQKRYEKGQNGNAYLTYIDISNSVKKVDTGTPFQELFTSPKTYFEPLAFWPTAQENVYRYYGYNARWLVESLTHYDIGITESIEVTVKDGKVNKILAKTPKYYDSYGHTYYTQAEIDVAPTRLFSNLEPFVASDKQNEILATFALLDGSTKFKADIITNGNREHAKTIRVVDNILLMEENGYDTSDGADSTMIKSYYGYEKTDEGVVPFKVKLTEDDAGTVTGQAKASDDIIAGITLKEMIGMVAAPEIFEKDSMGNIVVRPMVEKLNDGVFSGQYGEYIIPQSFRLETDAEGIPLSITYNYEIGDGYTLGEETIEFSEWGTATLPAHIDFENIGLWNAPNNWKEEFAPELYEEVVNMFGEEYVSEIPYIFSKELYGSWFLNNTSVDGYSYIHFISMKDGVKDDVYPNYAMAYAAYLEELGYEISNDNPWGLQAYTKGDIHIRIVYNIAQIDLFIFNQLP